MKTLSTLVLILLGGVLMGADINLKGKLPEDFDWAAYFENGDSSTGGQMVLANAAANLLKNRMDELCNRYRALLTKRGDPETARLFDEMQANWQRAADAEVSLVGSAWGDGSGAKEAYPKQRFKIYLRRIKELKALKSDCMFLNEYQYQVVLSKPKIQSYRWLNVMRYHRNERFVHQEVCIRKTDDN